MSRIRIPTPATLILALSLAGCGLHAGGNPARTPIALPTRHPGPIVWLISGEAVNLLGSDPVVASTLDKPSTLLITGDELQRLPAGWDVSPVATFTDYNAIHSAVVNQRLDPHITAVLYDLEDWSFTPINQQGNPAHYMALAADLLHAHHLRLIGTPSVSLVNIVAPGPGRVFPRFIDAGIAGGVAKSTDVIDIQAQGSVRDPQLYTSFVTEAAAQARLANPEVIVLAGLSTNPSGAGGDVSVDQLAADVRMTQGAVEGYWLNVPVPGPYCPRCTGARPDLAVALLRALASS